MKILKGILILAIVLGIGGYALYHFGTGFASDKIVDYVNDEMENAGQVEEAKRQIAANPELKKFLEEGLENVDESNLVYKTKEEAVQGVIKKVGISKLMELQSEVSDGVTAEEQTEILAMLQENLNEDEILALKYLANQELNR
ncbi:hypothetical protein D3H55_14505 [Bacillus salacetis]|uniref:Phenylalanyl-tRNA synthetase subunit beta n=1 Tax=Bacillus salacetis TaxID=2315464 RepID=A0A3A1R0F4_9BACI|nr:hypothetical protein [Bacillus salacetis]RIW31834.1 hypothetical protein D3H55_14505 [Bacillus salacetis]